MNADIRGLKHKELTETIIGVFFEVYNELGHGFLESVYERAFEVALTSKGLDVCRQIQVPVWFRGHKVGDFVADILVNRLVLLELKAARTIDSAHEAQLLNYLRATEIEVGLLFNFGIKPEFRRLAFDNSRKQVRQLNEISIAALLKPNE
jgi:GxxExxY protein